MSIQSEIDRILGNIVAAYVAVAEKGGTVPADPTSGNMAKAIRSIPTEGGSGTGGTGWQRPSDWPDYSKISLEGFEGMYFTYNTSRAAIDPTEFCAFTVSTYGGAPYLVERGQIIGSEFVTEESYSVNAGAKFAEWLTPTESGYVVYRVTSEDAITRIQMSASDKYDGGERTPYTQFCVERYGRLPNATAFSNWRLSYVVSDTILNCKKLTNLSNCWQNCYSLTSLDLSGWDTSAVTNLSYCWYNCSSLTSLDLSGWDTSAVTSLSNCWSGCSSLVRLRFCSMYKSFSISGSTRLTVTSLVNVLGNLSEVASQQTVTIGSSNKTKLTQDQLAVATAKNWVVA